MSEVKKYKLIKTYPGSKPLGTVEEVVMYNGIVFTNDASKLYNIYPEFWEEVKEYKLRHKKTGLYLDIDKYDMERVRPYSIFYGCKESDFERVCKEEVKEEKLCVPVGTKFRLRCDNKVIYTITTITNNSIEVTWLGLESKVKENIGYTIPEANNYFKKGHWIECKPLFKTNDNVDIFEGDTFYFVASTSWGVGEMVASDIAQAKQAIARFSTKEAAEKYVDRHKPIYNRVQVNDAILKSLLEYMSDVPKALKYKEVIIKNLQEL